MSGDLDSSVGSATNKFFNVNQVMYCLWTAVPSLVNKEAGELVSKMPSGFQFLHLVLSTSHKILKGEKRKTAPHSKIDLYLWVGKGLNQENGSRK